MGSQDDKIKIYCPGFKDEGGIFRYVKVVEGWYYSLGIKQIYQEQSAMFVFFLQCIW